MEKRFENGRKLVFEDHDYAKQIKTLDLSAFPLINDFTVQLRDAGEFGQHIDFASKTFGLLTGFPWWDNVEKDLPKWDARNIPLGSLDQPFEDCEQGWQIVLFETVGYVYAMAGDDPCCTEFSTWFCVERKKYIDEWLSIIRRFNPVA